MRDIRPDGSPTAPSNEPYLTGKFPRSAISEEKWYVLAADEKPVGMRHAILLLSDGDHYQRKIKFLL